MELPPTAVTLATPDEAKDAPRAARRTGRVGRQSDDGRDGHRRHDRERLGSAGPRTSSSSSSSPSTSAGPLLGSPLWPAGLAVLFTLAQLALVVPGSGLGWDEAVYVSQVGGNAPAAFFSAPRARGVSYLVAPVAAFTDSTVAIRVYLALLSGAALWGALRAWRGILPASVLTAGGALFTGLWVTLFYGPRVMPNLWCAFGALAAVGFFLRVADGGRGGVTCRAGAAGRGGVVGRAALVGLGLTVAGVTLFRPGDGLWLVLPLGAAALLVPAWRRRATALTVVLAGGLALGALPWIVEAYAHYGGLAARLRRAGEIQGSLGWYLSVDDHVRALVGRTLCRPCDVPWDHPFTAVWWFLLPAAVAAGVVAAFRAGRGAPALLATVTAAALAAPYLFTVGYAAPRFLLPAYALLAVPVGECAVSLFAAVRSARWRRAGTALLAVALLGHLAVQYAVLDRAVSNSRSVRVQFTAVASALHGHGVRPPCLVTGREYVLIGYYAGCSSRQPRGHDESITPDGIAAAARRMPVAVIVPAGAAPPDYARAWRSVRLPSTGSWERHDAYVSPRTRR
ncbi:hypothetical protein R1T08_16870 [Streptomyces sp. SBC-4]|nr:hypothetical protein [Streptomyces sp. SBC-4]MDV5145835.1 hypothetical protein [Streptomyces sp. SBC-4]